jgi:hypothetical protein
MRTKERAVHEGLVGASGHTAEELKAITAQLIRVRDTLDAAAQRRAAAADEIV